MKSNTLTYTIAQLNTVNGTKKDARLSVTRTQTGHPAYNEVNWPSATTDTVYFYARHLKVDNNSGADVEFVVLSNDYEESVYDASPSTYPGWIKLTNGSEYEFDRMGKISKLVFRVVSPGVTTSDLRVDLWGYFTI